MRSDNSNNMIAIAIHAVITALLSISYLFMPGPESLAEESALSFEMLFVVVSLLYIMGGGIFLPQNRKNLTFGDIPSSHFSCRACFCISL